MGFTVVIHHMGGFIGIPPSMDYDAGEIDAIHGCDIDKWSYFEAVGLVKELGYKNGNFRLWWKHVGPHEGGVFRPLELDSQALQLANDAITEKNEANIYVEHKFDEPEVVEVVELHAEGEGLGQGQGQGEGLGQDQGQGEGLGQGQGHGEGQGQGPSLGEGVEGGTEGLQGGAEGLQGGGEEVEGGAEGVEGGAEVLQCEGEGEGQRGLQGEGESEGQRGLQGEGESEGQGGLQGEGQGQGQGGLQGESEGPVEGEGEGQGQGGLQGEGEGPVEGEGEGLGEGPIQGEVLGECPIQGEGLGEGKGQGPILGEGVEGGGEGLQGGVEAQGEGVEGGAKGVGGVFEGLEDVIEEVHVSEGHDGVDEQASDEDSVHDLRLSDSEEERDIDLDDGFGFTAGANDEGNERGNDGMPDFTETEFVEGSNMQQSADGSGRQCGTSEGGKKTRRNRRCRRTGNTYGPDFGISRQNPDTFAPINEDGLYEMEEEYISDELYSGSSDSEGSRSIFERYKKIDMCETFEFKLGMEFASLNEFKEAILEHSVLNGRQVRFKKNDKVRVRAVCSRGCPFEAFVSKVGKTSTFRMKLLKPTHTCGRVLNNKNANSKWVAKTIVEKMRSNTNMSITEVIDEVRRNYSTSITFWRAWSAKNLAKQAVEGDVAKQYTLLWRFAAELRRASLSNTCKLRLERPDPILQPRFGSFYMCLEGCKRGFLEGCRPFIGVDGCHLKTKHGGVLLIAVGRDPNDQYYPLAVAVVQVENTETWRWFLKLLLEDIGDMNSKRWVFISDQQKGLMQVFEDLLEGVEHRFCLRHLYNNFKKRFGGGTLIRDLMMAAAKATYQAAYEQKMREIHDINPAAAEYLSAIPKRAWCKHSFSYYPRCDVLMNNLSEAFNSTILLAREKPIVTMCQWIRHYLMNRFSEMRLKLSKYTGEMMPKPKKRLDWEVKHAGNWVPTLAGQLKWEVRHLMFGDSFVVNLQTMECTCNFWQLVGIPCRHAVSAISHNREDPERYVHAYYKRDAYLRTYSPEISALNGQDQWPQTNDPEILPPVYKRGAGRPKKLRRREPDEESTRLGRATEKYRCAKCHQLGYNVRRCKNPAVPGYVPRVPKKKKNDQSPPEVAPQPPEGNPTEAAPQPPEGNPTDAAAAPQPQQVPPPPEPIPAEVSPPSQQVPPPAEPSPPSQQVPPPAEAIPPKAKRRRLVKGLKVNQVESNSVAEAASRIPSSVPIARLLQHYMETRGNISGVNFSQHSSTNMEAEHVPNQHSRKTN